LKYSNHVENKKLRILDIGCGNGEFLAHISDTKFEKYGLEINTKGYELCKEKKLNVFNEELKDVQFEDGFFDVITLWHVIEHLEFPHDILQSAKKLLNKEGILIIATPNTNSLGFRYGQQFWYHLDSPRHLVLFNDESLKYILKACGLKTIKQKYLFYDYCYN
jgi:2-polyprenyl-3-methyl-5-hydroxy-6-metoxy-1,4-benzoquinol methylase